jgi:hypothetical protein
MATAPTPSDQIGAPSPLLEKLAPYTRQVSYVFLGLALLMVGLAVWWMTHPATAPAVEGEVKPGPDYFAPRFLWALVVAVVFVILAVVNFMMEGNPRFTKVEWLRILLMTAFGLLGLSTAVLGIILPLTFGYKSVFAGGLTAWRANKALIAWPILANVGGLLILFLSLQLIRGQERASGLMRRLLYGYNAVLSCLLLLYALVLVNVMAYANVPPFTYLDRIYDWTSSGVYSLSDKSRSLLGSLQEPVKVYVIPQNEIVRRELESLLESVRSANPAMITWETVSRDRNRSTLAKLEEKFRIPEPAGLLVVYGKEDPPLSDFVRLNDMFSKMAAEGGAERFGFAGEGALMKSIDFLASGKAKARVYFLQGHGELDVSDRNPGRPDEGIGILFDQLGKGNYEPKELKFGAETSTVPDDAEVVVIARPKMALPARDIDALRAYLKGDGRKKKGRLIVLLDVVTRDGKMVKTGLEDLVAEYNVRVGDDRVVAVEGFQERNNPVDLEVFASPLANNPLARGFNLDSNRVVLFNFIDARTVTALNEANPAAPRGNYTVDQLILISPNDYTWTETDLSKDPLAVVRDATKNLAGLMAKISRQPLSLAVTVSEPKLGDPMNPHDFRNRENEPRMAVFGDATWVSNYGMSAGGQQGGAGRVRNHLDLFTSTLAWLRGRPDIGTGSGDEFGPPKTRKEVVLNVKQEDTLRVLMLPGTLMILGIFGLGVGVWVVRRR